MQFQRPAPALSVRDGLPVDLRGVTADRLVATRSALADFGQESLSVVTRMKFAAAPERVWEGLMFYEQIGTRPPLVLRVLLPTAIRTEGRKSHIGNEVKCHYVGGHLLKRVTQITPGWNYAFEVIEQNLTFGGGIRLLGGGYALRDLFDGRTQVALETRYVSSTRPRWVCKRIEAAVCHSFHRHILHAMRRELALC